MSDAKTYVTPANGQEVRTTDIGSLSENGGQAVDRALWEFLRLAPPNGGTPDRAIIPYGQAGGAAYPGLDSTATVQGNTADAIVRVMPFRAVIGPTAALADPYEDNLRGQRSAYAISSSFYTEVTIGINSSGNPRWDLIYARVTPDAVVETDSVLVKSGVGPAFAVAPATKNVRSKTTVVIDVTVGVAAAPPAYPTQPADGAGNYVIPLAYVYVPDGFGAASTVLRQYIFEVAPVYPLHESTGTVVCRPASSTNDKLGVVEVNQDGNNRTGPNYYPPSAYLPGSMVSGVEILVPIQLSLSPASYLHNDVVDDKIDWRFRFFEWRFQSKAGSTSVDGFASSRTTTGTQVVPAVDPWGGDKGWGFGQSFVEDNSEVAGPPAGSAVALNISSTDYPSLGAPNKGVSLYVDMATGELKISFFNAPGGQIFVWLKASGQYKNYGTV